MTVPSLSTLPSLFGNIDLYLFDQILKRRISEGMSVLDAGCGTGRNIEYLMQAGVAVHGVDSSVAAIEKVRELAKLLAPQNPTNHFILADIADLPYPDASFEVVLCSAVLHFAKNENHFRMMVQELWRVLQPGGMLFSRFSTTIGMAGKLQQAGEHLYQMPHGQVWFLADEAMLVELQGSLAATMLEPLKTVLVGHERSMTTWVLQKPDTFLS
ncbi:methyltransferase family protein [Pontibacter ummariensis]|uniref:Methyltransferase domain-containing protein n=1 Tax=Pontibacter ummariensis TaxID=1610492 RepID=A0A239C353_9BACT|nr:class I SAM-dependent methyltransferase [Pontibacter ummariensis]PRY15507.1 methyltransferase family protein [Pontibacter ummariensis]SNS13844.1 Methyltransferase domain-containing protein [Pontibacter ummariensis]